MHSDLMGKWLSILWKVPSAIFNNYPSVEKLKTLLLSFFLPILCIHNLDCQLPVFLICNVGDGSVGIGTNESTYE